MKNGYTKFSHVLLLFIFVFMTISVEAKPETVLRVAVLDNPHLPEKLWMWHNYESAYLKGIKMAQIEAKKHGILLEYKIFFYGTHPLDILKKIPEVKKWNPDFILGPQYSNQFLLLRKDFTDTLVVSPYVSDLAIKKMPSNFYSLSPTDDVVANTLARFIVKKFPDKDINLMLQVDCKACEDIALLLKNNRQFSKKTHFFEKEFIGNDINNIDIEQLIEGYKKGNIFYIQATNYYFDLSLAANIVRMLNEPKLVFFTAIDFNGGNIRQKKNDNMLKYDMYRFGLLLLDDPSTKGLKQFQELYVKYYGKPANNSVSYMTYISIVSVVDAFKAFPVQTNTMREKILASYRKALKNDPHWYQPRNYGIYLYQSYSGKKEQLVEIIPAFESKESP